MEDLDLDIPQQDQNPNLNLVQHEHKLLNTRVQIIKFMPCQGIKLTPDQAKYLALPIKNKSDSGLHYKFVQILKNNEGQFWGPDLQQQGFKDKREFTAFLFHCSRQNRTQYHKVFAKYLHKFTNIFSSLLVQQDDKQQDINQQAKDQQNDCVSEQDSSVVSNNQYIKKGNKQGGDDDTREQVKNNQDTGQNILERNFVSNEGRVQCIKDTVMNFQEQDKIREQEKAEDRDESRDEGKDQDRDEDRDREEEIYKVSDGNEDQDSDEGNQDSKSNIIEQGQERDKDLDLLQGNKNLESTGLTNGKEQIIDVFQVNQDFQVDNQIIEQQDKRSDKQTDVDQQTDADNKDASLKKGLDQSSGKQTSKFYTLLYSIAPVILCFIL